MIYVRGVTRKTMPRQGRLGVWGRRFTPKEQALLICGGIGGVVRIAGK